MTTPEISYHCALCGTALRHNAAACPQCSVPEEPRNVPTPVSSWLLQPALTVATAEVAATPRATFKPSAPPRYEPVPVIVETSAARVTAPAPEIAPPRYAPTNDAPLVTETASQQPAPPPEMPAFAPVITETDTAPSISNIAPTESPDLEAIAAPLPETAINEGTLSDASANAASDAIVSASNPVTESAAPENAATVTPSETPRLPPVTVLTPSPAPRRRRRSSHRRYGPPTFRERLTGYAYWLRDSLAGLSQKFAPTMTNMRRTSNIMLDRASDDPSARFAAISLALIVVAALVWLISFFLG